MTVHLLKQQKKPEEVLVNIENPLKRLINWLKDNITKISTGNYCFPS